MLEVRLRNIQLPLVLLAFSAIALAMLPASARALTGGAPANRDEAPWAAHLWITSQGGTVNHCSGSLIRQGLVLTAAHCMSSTFCTGRDDLPRSIRIRFGRAVFSIRDANGRWDRHPNYTCFQGNRGQINDVAVVRFKQRKALPVVTLANGAEIDSVRGKGVTLFGGGLYRGAGGVSRFSTWIRKSKNGGFFLNPFCQVSGDLCFRQAGSAVQPGDSGGPWVGWIGGGWRQIGVVSGYVDPGDGSHIETAGSLSDPSIRGWIDQQLAVPAI